MCPYGDGDGGDGGGDSVDKSSDGVDVGSKQADQGDGGRKPGSFDASRWAEDVGFSKQFSEPFIVVPTPTPNAGAPRQPDPPPTFRPTAQDPEPDESTRLVADFLPYNPLSGGAMIGPQSPFLGANDIEGDYQTEKCLLSAVVEIGTGSTIDDLAADSIATLAFKTVGFVAAAPLRFVPALKDMSLMARAVTGWHKAGEVADYYGIYSDSMTRIQGIGDALRCFQNPTAAVPTPLEGPRPRESDDSRPDVRTRLR